MGVGQRLAVGELVAIARQVAVEYGAHRAGLELDDLAQEALTVMLAAQRALTAVPESLSAYLATAARCAVRAYSYETLAPVRVSRDRRDGARQAQAATRASETELTERPATSLPADDQLAALHLGQSVRQQLREVTAGDPVAERAVVWRVLIEEESSATASEAEGVPLRLVYQITERTKRRLLKDARTRALWRDLSSREVEE